MRNDTPMTLIGNLVSDPEMRFTGSGIAVVRFTVASTPRIRDGQGNWSDGEPTYMDCTAWRKMAENVAESFTRGSRVIVAGRLITQRWQTDEGEKRSRIMLEVDDVGASVAFHAVRAQRPERGNGSTPASEDPWANEPPSEHGDQAATDAAPTADTAVTPAKKTAAKKTATRSKSSE